MLIQPLPRQQYQVILADPPWEFENYSEKGEGKSAKRHYPTMPTAEIAAMPVMWNADQNCGLFLWATFSMLPDAMHVMVAWGFKYKTGLAWPKTTKNGKLAFGTGYLCRDCCELLLYGSHGQPERKSKSVRNVIEGSVREHSRKPDDTYVKIEKLFPHVPKLELFARQQRAGWDCWGNETDKFTEAA